MNPWSSFSPSRKEVLRCFLRGDSLTKQDISTRIGQSVPAAASHIEALLEESLVLASGIRPSQGGRPAEEYRINRKSFVTIGVEVRPRYLRSIAVSIDGFVYDERRREFEPTSAEMLEHAIEEELQQVRKELPDDLHLRGVGIALPGIVDCTETVLVNAPNLFLSNVSLRSLESRIELPVFVENEANAGAFAEYRILADAPKRSLVYVSITEGLGGGIILNGQIVHGDTWRAGEFGHMAIREGVRKCNCGRSGCWEQYASERALLRDAFPGRESGGDVHEFLGQLDEHDSRAETVWSDYIYSLAIGIENIVACVDTDLVVIAGDIATAGKRLVEPLSAALGEVSFLTKGVRVAISGNLNRGSLHGATLLPYTDLLPGMAVWRKENHE